MADTIFFGGDIITVDDNNPEAEALAVQDGKIIAVGAKDDVLQQQGDNTEMIDLEGKTLMPGIIEPHSHPFMSAFVNNFYTNISGYKYHSRDEAVKALLDVKEKTPPGEWIKAFGYDPVLMPDIIKYPKRTSIDRSMGTDNPVIILAQTCHTAYCNTTAFQLSDITEETPAPHGGDFIHEPDGSLNGMVTENPAISMVLKQVPQISKEQLIDFIKIQLNEFMSHGITTIAELGVGLGLPVRDAVQFFREVGETPECPLRLIGYVPNELMTPTIDAFEVTEPDGSNVHILGPKFFGDGSPYTGTMAVHEPYMESHLTTDCLAFPDPPCYGKLNHMFETLITGMRPFHNRGFQIAIHTQGERAVHQALDVFAALLREHPRDDHRHRMEHCGLIRRDHLERAKSLGVQVSFFLDHVYFYGRALRDGVIGEERAARWAPLRTATELGINWSVHSDTPCCPTGPFRVMRTALTRFMRTDDEHREDEALGPDETVGIDDVIKAVTINAAYHIRHEKLIGSLEVGKLADLVIISENPRKKEPKLLDEIEVISTYKNGKLVVPW